MRRPSLAILLLLTCAALLAACGGGGELSKEDYERDVKQVNEGVEEDLDALGSEDPSAEDIEQAEERIGEAADELEDLDPPSSVQDTHDDFVSTMRDTGELMGRIAPLMERALDDPTKMGEDDVKELEEVQADFTAIEERMAKVEEEFQDEDIDIGLNVGDSGDEDGDEEQN